MTLGKWRWTKPEWRISQSQTEFEITVDQVPTRAGIDPYNKLVDRQPDDNTVVVSESLMRQLAPSVSRR
jgi:hypothetical protein